MEAINGDLSVRVVVDSRQMPWSPSPSPSVWRKRLHLVGPAESGQVTSIVRYEPGSQFHAHEHPAGEEILVLDGVFSDEHGDWPAGSYLLNPEGFRHTPYSRDGCLLFVKLRQFPGPGRRHVAIDTEKLPWQADPLPGVSVKALYSQPGFTDTVRLERWAPGTDIGIRHYADGAELLVLDGQFADEHGAYATGTWMRLPPGYGHAAKSADGCTLYVKEGGFTYLQPAT